MRSAVEIPKKTACYHCGEDCIEEIKSQDKVFCCQGCKMVFEILNESGLCEYYDIEKNPGLTQKIKVREGKFAFLDNEEIARKLIHFEQGTQRHVIFYLPQMHCSSCIWLLEQLPKINAGIIRSQTNFLKREVTIVFDTGKTSLRAVAELLTRVGYEPHISLKDLGNSKIKKHDRSRIYKIGIAGFCFGNIMLLSFPEYLASVDLPEKKLQELFSFVNLALSLPVFFYCASEFFVSAWKGLRQKFLNIDAPIALAIVMTFGRSIYEIGTFTGAGYLDSMAGIVFFMLIGRYFQDRTYQSLTFDRDYTSYFPIGVTVINGDTETQKPVSDLKKGDRIRIHSQEIIPADGILFMGKANIDYSFVTGEALPTEKVIGEIIYAGGKQVGAAIELEIVKGVSQSYLTQLWNNDVFKKSKEEKRVSFVHRISRYFTYVLFSIAFLSAMYWLRNDSTKVWDAVTAILIIACPCALLLSATFTNGNMLARLQKQGFFVKNSAVLEDISAADIIVFDKTGTLSLQKEAAVSYKGRMLAPSEMQVIRSLAAQSNHPLSKALFAQLPQSKLLAVKNYRELKGKGSSGFIGGVEIKMGSEAFVCADPWQKANGSSVFVSFNNEVAGHYTVKSPYRKGLTPLIKQLQKKYRLVVLSGDNSGEHRYLRGIFGDNTEMLFDQSPSDKLSYIKALQNQGHKVIMVGDGLNDAGALQQSDAGIAVTDDVNNFSPGCDVILEGRQFPVLDRLLAYSASQKKIIYGSFVLSIMYNIAGLFYAAQGELLPVIAAILMPASSISIVFYTTAVSSWMAKKIVK